MMKKILFAIFLVPVFLSAQTVSSDTSYVITENNTQFYLTVTTYTDGSVTTIKQPKVIAEANAVARFKQSLAAETTGMINNCAVVSEFNKHLRRIIKTDAQLKALTNVSCLDQNEDEFKAGFVGTWTLEQYKVPSTVTLSVNAQGRLRWSSGGNNGRVIIYAEGVIALNNWVGNQNLNLYSVSTGVWQSLDGNVTFKKA